MIFSDSLLNFVSTLKSFLFVHKTLNCPCPTYLSYLSYFIMLSKPKHFFAQSPPSFLFLHNLITKYLFILKLLCINYKIKLSNIHLMPTMNEVDNDHLPDNEILPWAIRQQRRVAKGASYYLKMYTRLLHLSSSLLNKKMKVR